MEFHDITILSIAFKIHKIFHTGPRKYSNESVGLNMKKKKNVFTAFEHWSTENMIKNMTENYLHINSEIFARVSRRAKNERTIIFYEFQRIRTLNPTRSQQVLFVFSRYRNRNTIIQN